LFIAKVVEERKEPLTILGVNATMDGDLAQNKTVAKLRQVSAAFRHARIVISLKQLETLLD